MRPLALTMGDPAGIGGELTLRAWQARRGGDRCFVALDDPDRLRQLARDMSLDVAVATVTTIDEVPAAFPDALPVLPIRLAIPGRPGQPDGKNAPAVVASIERATDLAARGVAGAVVTNPINKAALYDAGFAYPGHTEFLAA
ncbi:MAG TPA: 4-hydroxythreonine-4-phosphate dehydrogenase PdxA, partial [Acetobacteraceae bacterium]|nr:4-hydroxythreonine-4-phosphate dehydrogenase PdxA [Acetobacteraceae bacterium]